MRMVSLRAAAIVVLLAFASHAQAADKLKLGFLAAFSGPLGLAGGEMKRGFDVALEELGGKIGGLPVEVSLSDSKGSPNDALQGVSKLIDQDKIDIVTGMDSSNVILATTKTFTEAGIVVVGALGGPSELAGKDCDAGAFFTAFQNDEYDEVAGLYMKEKGCKRVFFMGLDYQGGWDHIAGAERTFGGTVAGKIFTPIPQVDFAAELAQVRAAKPDALFVFYPGAPGIAFVKQYAQAGLSSIPLLSSDALANELTFAGQGDAAIGITVGTNWGPDIDNPENKRFVADFKTKFGRPPTIFAALQYDAVRLIDRAVAEIHGKVEDRAALKAAIRKADFHSIRGPFRFNNNQFPVQDLYIEQVVKDPSGTLRLAMRGRVAEAWQDHYHDQCKMK
jgi:branched-chain amino acid transport system substrate-binding protein